MDTRKLVLLQKEFFTPYISAAYLLELYNGRYYGNFYYDVSHGEHVYTEAYSFCAKQKWPKYDENAVFLNESYALETYPDGEEAKESALASALSSKAYQQFSAKIIDYRVQPNNIQAADTKDRYFTATDVLDDVKIYPYEHQMENDSAESSNDEKPYKSDCKGSSDGNSTAPANVTRRRNVWTVEESRLFAELMVYYGMEWTKYKIASRSSKQIIYHWAKIIARLRNQRLTGTYSSIAFDVSLLPRLYYCVTNYEQINNEVKEKYYQKFSTTKESKTLRIELFNVQPLHQSTRTFMKMEFQRIKCSGFHDIILLNYLALYYDTDEVSIMQQLLI